MSTLDDRRVVLRSGNHVHLHLQRTALPYTLLIRSLDDVSSLIFRFFISTAKMAPGSSSFFLFNCSVYGCTFMGINAENTYVKSINGTSGSEILSLGNHILNTHELKRTRLYQICLDNLTKLLQISYATPKFFLPCLLNKHITLSLFANTLRFNKRLGNHLYRFSL